MIYNQDFVWIHFPKAAGSKIEALFQTHYSTDRSIHQDQVGERINPLISWHDSIADRQKRDPSFTLGNRNLIVCTRRLPSWLKSRFFFELRRTPKLKHDPRMLLSGKFFEQTGQINHADKYIRKWISPELRRTHQPVSYLRVEDFAADFRIIFGQFLDIKNISVEELKERENISSSSGMPYDIDALIADNLESIYKSCPLWAELETIVYGATVIK